MSNFFLCSNTKLLLLLLDVYTPELLKKSVKCVHFNETKSKNKHINKLLIDFLALCFSLAQSFYRPEMLKHTKKLSMVYFRCLANDLPWFGIEWCKEQVTKLHAIARNWGRWQQQKVIVWYLNDWIWLIHFQFHFYPTFFWFFDKIVTYMQYFRYTLYTVLYGTVLWTEKSLSIFLY